MKDTEIWTVYAHINKTNNKIYVGITSQIPEKRWLNGKGYSYNSYFNNAIKKYGWNNFEHEIIANKLTEQEAKNFEKLLIAKFELMNSTYGYNLTQGGNGTLGYHHTKETKEKLSQASKNMSKEQRENLIKFNTGKKHSEQTIKKMKLAHHGKYKGEKNNFYGKHHSEDSKNAMRNKLKGKYVSEKSWSSKKVICVTTGEIFNSTVDASNHYKTYHTNITKCCKHKAHFAGCLSDGTKLQWEYYIDGENYIKKDYINPKYRPVKCLTNGEIFNSIKEASNHYKISHSGIIACCLGRQKSAGKLEDGTKVIWEYC